MLGLSAAWASEVIPAAKSPEAKWVELRNRFIDCVYNIAKNLEASRLFF